MLSQSVSIRFSLALPVLLLKTEKSSSVVRPQLVLVDVRMPGMDGIETTQRIKERHPSTVVVLISIEGASNTPSGAADCGAAVLVRKQDFGPAKLREIWNKHGT